MLAVLAGSQVTDTDPVRAGRLQDGNSYVDEVPSDELDAALSPGRYIPTGGYAVVSLSVLTT